MKTAIIMSGGGMRASFCVGALLQLHENGIIPDIIIAGSGSAGTASYYMTGQHTTGALRIWTELLSTKKFINMFRLKKILDIDYLIDDVFKKQEPLQDTLISQNLISYLIPVTNASTGEINYFCNRDNDFDVYESMRATMAVPLVYGRNVKINGIAYTDGIFSSSPYFHIQKAKDYGAEKIIIIDSGARTNKLFYKLFLYIKPKKFRELHREYLKNNFVHSKLLTIIKPTKKIKFGILDNNQSSIMAQINEGKSQVVSYYLENDHLSDII